MKNRLALLSILLAAGLAMAGTATASGASDLLKFTGKEVRVVAMGDQLKIYENGKVVKEITIPEGEYNLTIGMLEHKLVFYKMTSEEMEKMQAEHEKEISKWIEIANKDSRVQELTNGEGIQYKGTKSNVVFSVISSEDEVILTVKVGDKYYKITIDLSSETVKSVEEQEGPVYSVTINR